MPSVFDEILIPTSYSAEASGGPEFASAIVRSGTGGAIAARNMNREDYVSRYEIEYGLLDRAARRYLRKFAVLREGMTRGFRFLAPDESTIDRENVGWLNPETGEVERLAMTDGVLDEFYLIYYFSDPCNNYTRRIVKPSPYDEVRIEVFAVGDEETVLAEGLIAANTAISGDIILETVEGELSAPYGHPFEFNFYTGKLTFTVAPVFPDNVIKISCRYHLPVAFADDWHKFSIDEFGVSGIKVPLEEILPAELGIV